MWRACRLALRAVMLELPYNACASRKDMQAGPKVLARSHMLMLPRIAYTEIKDMRARLEVGDGGLARGDAHAAVQAAEAVPRAPHRGLHQVQHPRPLAEHDRLLRRLAASPEPHAPRPLSRPPDTGGAGELLGKLQECSKAVVTGDISGKDGVLFLPQPSWQADSTPPSTLNQGHITGSQSQLKHPKNVTPTH